MTREEAINLLMSANVWTDEERAAVETIIPELAESEDERMMREFNDWLCEEIECLTNDLRDEEDRRTLNMLCYVLTKVKDWLEKQKEQKPEWELTEFQNAVRVMITEALTTHIKDGNGREMSSTVFIDDDTAILLSAGLLELAKNELAKRDEVITLDKLPPYDKGFQDGKAEAMADLERTYFCNPDKLPKWLKDDIARKELNAHTKGYNNGYKDAENKYNESVAYHFPIMPTTPYGWGCDGTHCTNPHHDCINCPFQYSSGGTITTPNTASGTSTATLHGNTSATDGKEHNPSFTD